MNIPQDIIDKWIYPKVCPMCSAKIYKSYPYAEPNSAFCKPDNNGHFRVNYYSRKINVIKDFKYLFVWFNFYLTSESFYDFNIYCKNGKGMNLSLGTDLNFINKSNQETIDKIERLMLLQ
jgi:hypothetical protein